MSVIDNYFLKLAPADRAAFDRIRSLVHQLAPDAIEVRTYGMPGFTYRGKYLLSFAAFNNHLSLFPGAGPVESLQDKLAAYKTSKGTIQFTASHYPMNYWLKLCAVASLETALPDYK